MTNFLDILDKYKFGIFSAMGTYLLIFIYFNLPTIEYGMPAIPDALQASMEIPPDDPELELQNMQIDPSSAKVVNAVRDINDQRERTYQGFSGQRALSEAEKSVYDLEREMKAETGGDAERERIQKEMEQRQRDRENQSQTTSNEKPSEGGENAPAGKVLVEWSLKDRIPHLNNPTYIRIPGYMCDSDASGVVTVRIVVDQSGNVVSAKYDPGLSSGANGCMVSYAEQYAMKSRFAYSKNAPKTQEGTISYRYIPQ